MLPYGRKNPLPFSFSERSHIGNLRQIRKQGKGRSSKRKENRRLSFLFAHRRGYGVVPAAGRGTFPPSADGESPAEVQRKTPRPSGANRLRGSCAPDNRCRKRCCPDRAYCCATRVPSIVCAEKERNSCFCAKKARSSLRKSAKSRIVGIKI